MSRLSGLTASDRHRVVASDFGSQAAATADWDAPSPVDGWRARDVVAHLTGWFPAFLADGGVRFDAAPSADDPAAVWSAHSARVQELFMRDDVEFSHPRVGTMPLADAVDRFYTADVFMHTWDLAQASGRRPDLNAEFAAQLLDGLRGMEEVLRSSGQYGPAKTAPAGADPVMRLAAFIGRDPHFADAR
ncbi:maleylpyruvate isomerase family mycothiol-dependent enzyme [Gordonia sp. LUNF6]|uniref:maleylpyruvate isomerase family mycothiol-dependent enzyme n=1 Tax=Gordonia sp. LUNF6 TaxID=3388658 RepID=UPI003999654C